VLPPQHRDLLAQHQQLGVLRRRRTRQQRHPANDADKDQVKQPDRHKPAILPADPSARQAYSQASHLCPILEPRTFSTAKLAALYPAHAQFAREWTAATFLDVAEGFITPADALQLIAAARASSIGG